MFPNPISAAVDFINSTLLSKKLSSIHEPNDHLLSEQEVSEGTFQKIYIYNDKKISYEEAVNYFDEEVTYVKHFACSLEGFGQIPSGVVSLVTVPLFGKAARHEFVILYTTNYLFYIEVASDPARDKDKSNAVVMINRVPASTPEAKKSEEEKILSTKYLARDVKEVEESKVYKLKFFQINSLVTYWIKLVRAGDQGYTLFQKNCKSLARSIEGFCRNPSNWDEYLDNIVYSMLGLFIDKPLGFEWSLAKGLYEKEAIEKIDNQEFKELVVKIKEIVADIRVSEFPYDFDIDNIFFV